MKIQQLCSFFIITYREIPCRTLFIKYHEIHLNDLPENGLSVSSFRHLPGSLHSIQYLFLPFVLTGNLLL